MSAVPQQHMTSEMEQIAKSCEAENKQICKSKAGAYCVDAERECDSAHMETDASDIGNYFMATGVSRKTQGQGAMRDEADDETGDVAPAPACAGALCQFTQGARNQIGHPGMIL
ncbi:MAG: hypothetical protein CL902_00670 [Dehalococcoidia bacterium]|nr:hypothetical protein [Dehalococcoidia bacterium]